MSGEPGQRSAFFFEAYLASQGIALGAKQETKTKAALDFFKAKLESDRLGGAPETKR